jgi:hypothetical protein
MGSLLALVGRTILEYITAIPGLLSHVAMEAAGEALLEYGPCVAIILIWRHPVITMGTLTGVVLIVGATLSLTETLSGEWSGCPRSLFSYETEIKNIDGTFSTNRGGCVQEFER